MAKQRAVVNAAEFAENWSRGMTGAVQKITQGVQRVTENPMEKAAAAQDRWLAGIQKAAQEGSYAAGCRRVTLENWRAITVAKVGTNLSAGVNAARNKVQEVAGQLLDHINAGLPTVNNMAKVTLEDGIAKSAAWIRHMANFRRA